MATEYEFTALSDELILIKWFRSPSSPKVEQQYLDDLKHLLDTAKKPVYFISDLRLGRIVTIRTINHLGHLTAHANWGGSTAFSRDPITKVFVGTFQRFTGEQKSRNEMFDTPEQALAFMETLKAGLTEGIDWNMVLAA